MSFKKRISANGKRLQTSVLPKPPNDTRTNQTSELHIKLYLPSHAVLDNRDEVAAPHRAATASTPPRSSLCPMHPRSAASAPCRADPNTARSNTCANATHKLVHLVTWSFGACSPKAPSPKTPAKTPHTRPRCEFLKPKGDTQ